MFCSVAPDVRAGAGCPGPVGLGVWAAAAVVSPGAGCPGSWPDVRGLEGDLDRFRWFSSSMDLRLVRLHEHLREGPLDT